ncbi:MAG: rhodanese-like domain-containing protein [Calditrichia bacterium]
MKWILVSCIIALIIILPTYLYSQFTLKNVEKRIEREHSVKHMTVDSLHAALSENDSANFVLFDVREKDEYDVSHLPNAVQLDPGITPDEFINTHSDNLDGKHAVFYCSVGKRSAILIEKLDAAAREAGATELSNLKGSIFRWYNSGFPVYNASGETSQVHPYDKKWGVLLNKRSESDSSTNR